MATPTQLGNNGGGELRGRSGAACIPALISDVIKIEKHECVSPKRISLKENKNESELFWSPTQIQYLD